jgi:hypothetical protein
MVGNEDGTTISTYMAIMEIEAKTAKYLRASELSLNPL